MLNTLSNLPPTESGAKLNLTLQEEESLRTVYRENADGVLVFIGMYDPEAQYGENDYIVPITSTYDGFELITKDSDFANVCGSTGDRASKTWHNFYIQEADGAYAGEWECRAETGAYYTAAGKQDYGCNDCICGGHVVKGQTNKYVQRGQKISDIYIIPICNRHNVCQRYSTDPDYPVGQGYYMKLKADTHAIKLKGTLSKA
jgi:hypothetical protein